MRKWQIGVLAVSILILVLTVGCQGGRRGERGGRAATALATIQAEREEGAPPSESGEGAEQPSAEAGGSLEVSALRSAAIADFRVLEAGAGRVSWREDGALLAMDKRGEDGYSDVYTIARDGSGMQCLTCDNENVPQANVGNPSWHPSGEFLTIQVEDPNLQAPNNALAKYLTSPGVGLNNNVWIMRADGSQFWQVTQVGDAGGALHPQFSHDGSKLLWSEMIERSDALGQWAIKLADVSFDGDQATVSNVQTLQPNDLQLYETHGFSEDGSTILFSGIPKGGYYWDMEIFTMELASGSAAQLTDNDEWDEHAHFTASGEEILWASSEGNEATKGTTPQDTLRNPPPLDMWIMNRDGSNPRRLTHFNDPSAPEHVNIAGGIGIGDWSLSPDGHTAAVRMRQGQGQNGDVLVLIDFKQEALVTE